jgi:hypothetical protein
MSARERETGWEAKGVSSLSRYRVVWEDRRQGQGEEPGRALSLAFFPRTLVTSSLSMFRSSSSPLSLSSQLPSNVPLLHRTARIRPADARDARSLRAPSLAQRSTPSSSPSPSLSSTTPTPSPSSSASSTPSPPAVQSATKPKLPSHSTGFSPLSKSTSPSSSSKLKPRAKIQPGLGGFKTTPPSTSFRPNSTSSPEPHPAQFARLARYNADLAQLGLPPTTRSSPPPEQTSSAPAKGKFEDPFLKSALRFNGPLVKGSRPRAQHRLGPSSSEREELKDFLSEKGRELLQRDQRKVHHRWAWEWFKEGKDLVDIGRQLASVLSILYLTRRSPPTNRGLLADVKGTCGVSPCLAVSLRIQEIKIALSPLLSSPHGSLNISPAPDGSSLPLRHHLRTNLKLIL